MLKARAFLKSLHGHLPPGARGIFINNAEVQCHDFPIAETDSNGTTYEKSGTPLSQKARRLQLQNQLPPLGGKPCQFAGLLTAGPAEAGLSIPVLILA